MRFSANVSQISEGLPAGSVAEEHQLLMRRFTQTRDRDTFQQLFLYFAPRVKALMVKAGADSAEADDLVQDVMVSVWRKSHLYVPERGSVATWIFTIARNARIDRLRRRSSQPYDDVESLPIVCDRPDGEEEAHLSQRAKKVAEALRELPAEQRTIIEYAYIEDLPQTEIATRLGVPLGTVKSRMRLAYAKLRAKLEEIK